MFTTCISICRFPSALVDFLDALAAGFPSPLSSHIEFPEYVRMFKIVKDGLGLLTLAGIQQWHLNVTLWPSTPASDCAFQASHGFLSDPWPAIVRLGMRQSTHVLSSPERLDLILLSCWGHFTCMITQMWRRLMLGIRQTQDVGPRGCRTKIPARRLGKCSEKWDYKEIHIQVKETWWKWGDCGNKQAATCSIECCLDSPSDLKLASFGATPLPKLRKQKVTPIELQVSSLSSVIEACPRMSWNSRSPTTNKASTTQPGLQLLFRKLALLLQ